MLKIQDSAYIGEGQSAVLDGKPGDPGSWRWHYGTKDQGLLRVVFQGGQASASRRMASRLIPR